MHNAVDPSSPPPAEKHTSADELLSPYHQYREVEATGVSLVPSHWRLVQLRRVARFRPSPAAGATKPDAVVTFLPMDAIGEDGTYDLDSTRSSEELAEGYSYFCQGDVIRAKVTPCFENGKGAYLRELTGGYGFGTTELFVMRPAPALDGRFLYYLTMGAPFAKIGASTIYGAHGVKRVSDDFVRSFAFGLPPLSEQDAIANHLDRETARIDALVAKKRRLIRLAGDRASLAVERTLLGGDPKRHGRRLNQGRAPGLPPGWAASPCRRLFREIDRRSTSGAEMMLAVSKSVGVLPRDEWTDREPRADTLEGYKLVEPGDIVINRMRAFNGALGVSLWHGIVSPDYAVLRTIADVDPRYFALLLRTPTFVDEMRRRLRGIGGIDMGNVRTPRINMVDFGQIVVPVPTLGEQRALVDQAESQIVGSRRLVEVLERAVGVLSERRQALITAATTGQIDVSQVAG